MKKYLLFSAVIIGLLGGALLFTASQRYRGFSHSVLVNLPKGTSSAGMAKILADAGVVRHEALFRVARAMRPFVTLQATPSEILDRIARGDVHYYEIAIREGSNLFDIAAAVDKVGFLKGADFLKAARNPAPILDLAPGAPSLEGFLFPATYRITRSATVDHLVRMMTEQFRRQWKIALKASKPPGPVLNFVTLASLIEKESGLAVERPIVASVYQNRLNRKIKLDADPTTIYAAMLQGKWRGSIYRSDLADPHPYNTYQNPGLPPGPIANPGLASLEAALRPAETDFLYFVAKGDGSGGHNFSADYSAHQRFVAMYRQRVRR
jgi:UPF0755 protein